MGLSLETSSFGRASRRELGALGEDACVCGASASQSFLSVARDRAQSFESPSTGMVSSARAPRAGRQSRRRYHIRRIRHLELKESGSIGTSALNQLCTDASFQSPVRNACVGSGIHSAIQSKVRPGDVRGLWTGDKPDHRCDLINRPVAVERHNNLLRHRPVA